jgi:hypothetical protein
MNWKTWQLVPVWAATLLGAYLLSKEMLKRFG